MTRRTIVHIDQNKCDGCGQCVPSCEEGAIRIVAGKARLVADVYCDGLGACLGHCPQDAIRLIEREAERFDEAAVAVHLATDRPRDRALPSAPSVPACPGVRSLPVIASGPQFEARKGGHHAAEHGSRASGGLINWPVQLRLVPPEAPFLHQADILLVADCVPLACADFHQRFLDGRPVVLACPKLDPGQINVQKLAEVIYTARPRGITVVHMEVPCCSGLLRLVEQAQAGTGVELELRRAVVSRQGVVHAVRSDRLDFGGAS